MLIPIPIGTTHAAAVRGTVWRFVDCEHCQQPYAYLLQLEATGQDHDLLFLDGKTSAARAQAQAEQNLLQKSRNVVVPMPCPHCGSYQDDMSRQLKDEASINLHQVAGAAIVLLSFIPLAVDVPHIWVATLLIATAGLAVIIHGCRLALAYDANAGDAAPRKEFARSHTVWGERLAALVAANAAAEPTPNSAPDGDGARH